MIKQELINHIDLLRASDIKYKLDEQQFITASVAIMQEYNCSFRYLRSDSMRNGHVRVKINRLTGERLTEIAINRLDNIGGSLYTIIHELTHLINEHATSRELTKSQAEVVADTVAWYFVNMFDLKSMYMSSHVANKWDVQNYSIAYINKMGLSANRYKLIIKQINMTKIILQREYLKHMQFEMKTNKQVTIRKQIKE